MCCCGRGKVPLRPHPDEGGEEARRRLVQPAIGRAALFLIGIGVLAAFVAAGLVASNGEARRQIKGGGLRVNDAVVTDEKKALTPGSLTPEGVVKLSMGKKKHILLKPA